jgi:hypothetical protein
MKKKQRLTNASNEGVKIEQESIKRATYLCKKVLWAFGQLCLGSDVFHAPIN